jgi:hypothetical protein
VQRWIQRVVNILGGALAGVAIVLCGGVYALLVAYGHQRPSPLMARGADVAFLLLALAAVALSVSLRLEGLWLALIGTLLVGYRFAPDAIWRLCVGTHETRNPPLKEPR